MGLDAHIFPLMKYDLPERVSGDNVARAPTTGDRPDLTTTVRGPQGTAIPCGHRAAGRYFVWERLVDHTQEEHGNLWLPVRWWGYSAEEDAWEPADGLDERKVHEYCRRVVWYITRSFQTRFSILRGKGDR